MDKDNRQEPLEIEAKWAPSDDPSEWQKQEKSSLEIWYYKLTARLDPDSWRQEEDRLPYKARLKNLPSAILKSLPIAVLLLCIYSATQMILSMLVYEQFDEGFKILNLRLVISWIFTVTIVMAWQVASYPLGRLKPTLKLILVGAKRNWKYFILMFFILAFSDIFENTDPRTAIRDLVNTLFVVVIFFGIVDVKLYCDDKIEKP